MATPETPLDNSLGIFFGILGVGTDGKGGDTAMRALGLTGAVVPLAVAFVHRRVVALRLRKQTAARTMGEQFGVALEQGVDGGDELPGDPRYHLVLADVALPELIVTAFARHEAGVEPRPLALRLLDRIGYDEVQRRLHRACTATRQLRLVQRLPAARDFRRPTAVSPQRRRTGEVR